MLYKDEAERIAAEKAKLVNPGIGAGLSEAFSFNKDIELPTDNVISIGDSGAGVSGGDVAGIAADFVSTGDARKGVGKVAGQAIGTAAGTAVAGPVGGMIGSAIGGAIGGGKGGPKPAKPVQMI